MSASDAELLACVSRIAVDLQQVTAGDQNVTAQLYQCRKLLADLDANVQLLLQQRHVLQERLHALQDMDYPVARQQLIITEILGARLSNQFDTDHADHVMARHRLQLVAANAEESIGVDDFLDKVPRSFEFSSVLIVLRSDLLYHYVLDEDGQYWWFTWSACQGHAGQCQFCLNRPHSERRAQLVRPLLTLKK